MKKPDLNTQTRCTSGPGWNGVWYLFFFKCSRARFSLSPSLLLAFVYSFTPSLLRSALHALAAARHVIVIVVHSVHALSARALHGVDALKLEVLGHGVGRRDGLGLPGWQDRLESLDLLGSHGGGGAVFAGGTVECLRELDVELHVKVAVVVVAV